MQNMKKILIISILLLFLPLNITIGAANSGLAGRILLQVEEHGEAWYVSPDTLARHYLGRPVDAWQVMREQGIGITNANLRRIPVGIVEAGGGDADGDGLSDALEKAVGTNPEKADTDGDGIGDGRELNLNYNPAGAGSLPISQSFAKTQAGRIFLQVESLGQAWYVSPTDNKRYFLGRPDEAWALMRTFGLGISNKDLSSLTRGGAVADSQEEAGVKEINTSAPTQDLRLIEKIVHEMINQERTRQGLDTLKWNDDLANVAREHSLDLANENKQFTGIGVSCDFPLIHHEGMDFGLYNSDRLGARGVNYFGKSGENIALMSAANILVRFEEDDPKRHTIDNCSLRRDNLDTAYQNKLAQAKNGEDKLEVIRNEIATRDDIFAKEENLAVAQIEWYSEERVAQDTVLGWLKSAGHRKNIIDPGFDEAGVGAAYVNGYTVVTQSFIKRVDCGFQGGSCCVEKEFFPYCYVPFECVSDKCSK